MAISLMLCRSYVAAFLDPANTTFATFRPTESVMKYFPIAFPLFLLGLIQSATASQPPNVIIFYVDDLGWQDVQIEDIDDPCPYETPNLVKLAQAGMTFTQAYSPAPTCSPRGRESSRGSIPQRLDSHMLILAKFRPDERRNDWWLLIWNHTWT